MTVVGRRRAERGSDRLALTSMKVPCLLDQPDASRRRDYAGNVSVALDLTGTSMREVYRSRQFHDFEHYGKTACWEEATSVLTEVRMT